MRIWYWLNAGLKCRHWVSVRHGCCSAGRRKGKMDGRKVSLERAVCSHCPAARLNPDTSSCVNFFTHIIFINIYVYYSIILFQVCFGQDFTLLNPAAMSRGGDQSQPKPIPFLCKQHVSDTAEQRVGGHDKSCFFSSPPWVRVCRTAVPQCRSCPRGGRGTSPGMAGCLGEGLCGFK